MRFAKRRDQSEAAIVTTLKQIGCDVERGTDSDLYVKAPDGRAYLIECKTPGPNERRRQRIQVRLKAIFRDQYKIAKTPVEALKAISFS